MATTLRRMDEARLKRLALILRDLKGGKSVQVISEERKYKKHMVYQSMYYLKRLGLLPEGFKNPRGVVYTTDIASAIAKEAGNGEG